MIYRAKDTDGWIFDFVKYGERYQGRRKTKGEAKDAEDHKRGQLVREHQEKELRARELQCQPAQLVKCPECEKFFNGEVGFSSLEKVFCSEDCADVWQKRQSPTPTLTQFIDGRFEPWAKSQFEHASPKTWKDWYRTNLRVLKAFAPLADSKLDKLTSETIADFAAQRQGEGLQVSSVNSSLRVLRRLLRMAVEWGAIASMPKINLLRGEAHRERVLSSSEEARYLAAAPEPLASITTILIDSGMRPEECFRLKWESVTWANGRNGTMLVTHGKTAAARRVLPMSPRVRAILENRWKGAGKPEVGWIWNAPTKSGHVEPSTLKKQHANTFKTIAEQAAINSLKPVRPFVLYSLRHTFLTRLGESGCNVWTLARIAGHASIQMSSRYVHPGEDSVLDALANFEAKAALPVSRQ